MKIEPTAVTIFAAALGIVFQGKNIAYMVGLAFTARFEAQATFDRLQYRALVGAAQAK